MYKPVDYIKSQSVHNCWLEARENESIPHFPSLWPSLRGWGFQTKISEGKNVRTVSLPTFNFSRSYWFCRLWPSRGFLIMPDRQSRNCSVARRTSSIRSWPRTSHKKFHLLGMAKMGNTKYRTESTDELTAKAILNGLKKSKSVKYSRRYRLPMCPWLSSDTIYWR